MFDNISDLKRLKKKTSINTKLKAKISDEVIRLRKEIDEILLLPFELQKEAFLKLKKPYTEARQFAYNEGVTSEESPTYALPAVCESCLFVFLGQDKDEINKVNEIMIELSDPNRPEEGNKKGYLKFIIMIVLVVLANKYTNIWIAAIIFLAGSAILGWKRRYSGQFNAK